MSTAEVKRLVADAAKDDGLSTELRGLERSAGVRGLVELARKRGYGFTEADVNAYLVEQQGAELTEEQLAGAVGGIDGPAVQLPRTPLGAGATPLDVAIRGTAPGPAGTAKILSW